MWASAVSNNTCTLAATAGGWTSASAIAALRGMRGIGCWDRGPPSSDGAQAGKCRCRRFVRLGRVRSLRDRAAPGRRPHL